MTYFLIVFDRRAGKLLQLKEYSKKQVAAAIKKRTLEEKRALATADVEVVMISAPSEEVLRQTHGRYFKTVSELAREGQELLKKH